MGLQSRPGGQAGFTLLEVLVVLVVIGLISATLFEALAQVSDARDRLGPFLAVSEKDGLLNSWFRRSVNGMLADKDDGGHRFVGAATRFSGLTLAPLGDDPGAPTPFQWDLDYATSGDYTTLVYSDGSAPAREIRRWPGSRVSFSYLGPDLVWHDSWPPGVAEVRQLPSAVRLTDPSSGFTVVGAVRTTVNPTAKPGGNS